MDLPPSSPLLTFIDLEQHMCFLISLARAAKSKGRRTLRLGFCHLAASGPCFPTPTAPQNSSKLTGSGIVAIAFPGTAARASAEYASWAERQADYEGLPSWHPETFLGHSPM